MENIAESVAEKFLNEAEIEYVTRNELLMELDKSYLSDERDSPNPEASRRSYINARNEIIWSSRRRMTALGREYEKVNGPGSRPEVDPSLSTVPKEAPSLVPPTQPRVQAPGHAPTKAPMVQQQPAPAFPVGYQLVPAKGPVSGARVAAGVLALVFSLWASIAFAAAVSDYDPDVLSAVFLFPSMWGTFVCGIVIMAKSRARGKAAPITLNVFTVLGLLGLFFYAASARMVLLLGLALAVPIIIMMLMDTNKSTKK